MMLKPTCASRLTLRKDEGLVVPALLKTRRSDVVPKAAGWLSTSVPSRSKNEIEKNVVNCPALYSPALAAGIRQFLEFYAFWVTGVTVPLDWF